MLDVPAARTLLRQTRPRHHTHGYPDDTRASVTRLVRSQLAKGACLHAIAIELDVNRGTLKRWLDQTAETSAFIAVVVQDSPEPEPEPEPELTPESRLVLLSPTGYRLDGLRLDQAIHALRQLS